MNEEIVVRYRWTADEMLKAQRWYLRQASSFPRWGYWALMILCVAIPVLLWWRSHRFSKPFVGGR